MTRLRSLAWLIALIAFLAPSFGAGAAMHPAASMEQGLMEQGLMEQGPMERDPTVDCPDHAAPPADPCPDRGTAKHAAGQCCPMMSCVFAVLPPAAAEDASPSVGQPLRAPVHILVGLIFTQDPPPPRV